MPSGEELVIVATPRSQDGKGAKIPDFGPYVAGVAAELFSIFLKFFFKKRGKRKMTSSSSVILSQLYRLVPEVQIKFNRYSVVNSTGNRLLNFAGFKYLLHSCPSLFYRGGDEGQVAALFTQISAIYTAGGGGGGGSLTTTTTATTTATSKSAKLTIDGFMSALVSIAK